MAFQSSGVGARAAINVTPLVDVVLVMLIIFLVATPLMVKKIEVVVPPKEQHVILTSEPIVLRGNADGSVTLKGRTMPRTKLAGELFAVIGTDASRQQVVFVDFDDEVGYREAVGIMDTVRGVTNRRNATLAVSIRDGD